jgi:hypothetical protein
MFWKSVLQCFVFLFIVFATIEKTNAQSVRQFISEPIQAGARAAALGDAYVSDPFDVNSVYWNPATLAFLETYSISASSIIGMDKSILRNNIALPYKVAVDQTVALGAASNYAGYFQFYSLDLSYARKLLPTLSAGILVDLGRAASRSAVLLGASGSLGVFYRPDPGVSYAFVYKGIGTDVRYSSDEVSEKLDYIKPSRAVLLGTTFWFPTFNRQPYLNISLVAEKIFDLNGFVSKAGIEVCPFQVFAVRFGVVSRPGIASGRAGFGLSMGRFRLDYAISPSIAEERVHQISVAFIL